MIIVVLFDRKVQVLYLRLHVSRVEMVILGDVLSLHCSFFSILDYVATHMLFDFPLHLKLMSLQETNMVEVVQDKHQQDYSMVGSLFDPWFWYQSSL